MKKKTQCKIKIVLLLILWCFCASFMETSVEYFISEPSLINFTCAVPLVYASLPTAVLLLSRYSSVVEPWICNPYVTCSIQVVGFMR